MLFKTRIAKKTLDPKQKLINEEMRFLLEPNERWFEKNLQAHLLDEGCNFPIILAKPRFYKLMLTGLASKADPAVREQLDTLVSAISRENIVEVSHKDFFQAMRFFSSNRELAGQQMALEVTNSIQTIHLESQVDDSFFQADRELFSRYIEEHFVRLWKTAYPNQNESIPTTDLLCRRLYAALTTSLLRKMNARQVFEEEFHSIPRLLKSMRQDRVEFCRFMAFCQKRVPYFIHVVSQTFWRTLETFRYEMQFKSSIRNS